jgi:hypothetical protein
MVISLTVKVGLALFDADAGDSITDFQRLSHPKASLSLSQSPTPHHRQHGSSSRHSHSQLQQFAMFHHRTASQNTAKNQRTSHLHIYVRKSALLGSPSA